MCSLVVFANVTIKYTFEKHEMKTKKKQSK